MQTLDSTKRVSLRYRSPALLTGNLGGLLPEGEAVIGFAMAHDQICFSPCLSI